MANSIIHDLKNPMTAIRSCADLIEFRSSDPGIAEFTRLINKSVDKMLDMTQELLDFARGESSLQPTRIPAGAVLTEIAGELRHLVPEKVHLVREGDCGAEIMVDCGCFARVLMNLVKNAVEAMPHGGILRLALREHGGRVLFQVIDTGIGISDDLLPRLFEPFVTHGKSKGTGLGLAIAKSVVEAHRGAISVRSTPGAGTAFEISLPPADAA